MRKTIISHVPAAAVVFCVAALALSPRGPVGEVVERAGVRAGYALRKSVEASSRIVLVEIDDASIEALGPWPWDEHTIAKLFEGPFFLTDLTVSLVSPEDFRGHRRSGEAFWKGLAGLPSVAGAFPAESLGVPLDVLNQLAKEPAGAQASIIRNRDQTFASFAAGIPRWRSQAIRGIVRRAVEKDPDADAEEIVREILAPYWGASDELGALAHFWYDQAKARSTLAVRKSPVALSHDTPAAAESGAMFLPPAHWLESPVGFAGNFGESLFPRVAAFVALETALLPRLALTAAASLPDMDKPLAANGELVVKSRQRVWRSALGREGGLLVNWVGNARTPWYRPFASRVSAAMLVEFADARRAQWDAYRQLEKEMGSMVLAGILDDFDDAVASGDPELMAQVEREITVHTRDLTNSLEDIFQKRRAPEEFAKLSTTRAHDYLTQIYRLRVSLAELSNGLNAIFAPADRRGPDKVAVIVPTAKRFATMRTPWGDAVPPAALEVSLLNSILTGKSLTEAPRWAFWAAVAAGLVLAVVTARLGGMRAVLTGLAATAGVFFLWYGLFDAHGVILSFSAVLSVPLGCAVGIVSFAVSVGRRQRRLKRLFRRRLDRPTARRAGRRGELILREVREAAVLAVSLEPSGGTVAPAELDRYARQVARAIISGGGVLLEAASDVEGAFGWTKSGDAFDGAIFCGLSAGRRLKLLSEKLRADGLGGVEMRMAAALGSGALRAATLLPDTIVTSGEVFEKARRGLAAARRYGAGIVITQSDRAVAGETYELRRLDVEGRFWEVLEKKGALAVTMREVRDLYEGALAAFERGEKDRALALIKEALELAHDGPSVVLCDRIEKG